MNRIVRMLLKNWWHLPGLYGKLCHYAKHTDEYPEAEKYAHIQHILKLAVASGNVTMEVSGTENIPQQGGFMLYANHQGLFDILAIVATCDQPIGCVLKKELYKIPFLNQLVHCTKSFPMDRENVRQSLTVIQSVIAEVKKGRNYLIFPEGTRSKLGNRMLPFHHGSFRCATKTHCPVVPIMLIDCFRVLDQKGSEPVTVQIRYLPPILWEEYQHLSTVELANLVQSRIAEAMAAIGI